MKFKFNSLIALSVSVLVLGLHSCEETLVMDQSELNGTWNLIEAKRNKKSTKTLKGTFFKFSDGEMTNNITEAEKLVPFKLDGNRIVTEGDVTHHYYVFRKSRDTIMLKTKIQSNKFEFVLLKESEDDK